ncbi:MAG TPA: hypothetical protein PK402_08280 [Tepidisphaeraceae bacterium]|nr:hypothetical protein [Tepidisphaeraceae bacterium]
MSLIATISPWFVRLNIAEACVWFAIALGLLIFSKRRSIDLILILTLIAFGISDLVETKTGG